MRFRPSSLYVVFPLALVAWIFSYLNWHFAPGARVGLIVFPLAVTTALLKLKREKQFGFLQPISTYLVAALSVISFGGGIYYWVEYYELTYTRAGLYTPTDLAIGACLVILGLILAAKAGALFICIAAGVMLFYCYLGPYFPGMLEHPGLSLTEIIAMCSCDIFRGMFGSLTVTVIVNVTIFLLLPGLFFAFGGFDLILGLCRILARRSIAFIPQTAVFGSMGFGMISGAPASNVAATGSFTIPLMKRVGIEPRYAGAIEAVASTGGQIMPPIMGIAAFLMVAFTGYNYFEIMKSAIWGAMIFYLATAYSVYLIGKRTFAAGETTQVASLLGEKQEKLSSIMIDAIPMVASLVVLVSLLASAFAIPYSGIRAIGTFLLVSFIGLLLRRRGSGLFLVLKEYGKKALDGIVRGGEMIASIMLIIIPIGLIVGALTATAFNVKIANFLLFLGEANIAYVAVITALTCILFSFAVSTTATYIMVSMILAPALVILGLPVLVVHFYIFYYSILSNLTPPVAVASVMATKISGARFLPLCREGLKIALPLFVLPISFILYPNILLVDVFTPLIFLILLAVFLATSYVFFGQRRDIKIYMLILSLSAFLHRLIHLYLGVFAALLIFLILGKPVIGNMLHKFKFASFKKGET